jgi:hypothetical protein
VDNQTRMSRKLVPILCVLACGCIALTLSASQFGAGILFALAYAGLTLIILGWRPVVRRALTLWRRSLSIGLVAAGAIIAVVVLAISLYNGSTVTRPPSVPGFEVRTIGSVKSYGAILSPLSHSLLRFSLRESLTYRGKDGQVRRPYRERISSSGAGFALEQASFFPLAGRWVTSPRGIPSVVVREQRSSRHGLIKFVATVCDPSCPSAGVQLLNMPTGSVIAERGQATLAALPFGVGAEESHWVLDDPHAQVWFDFIPPQYIAFKPILGPFLGIDSWLQVPIVLLAALFALVALTVASIQTSIVAAISGFVVSRLSQLRGGPDRGRRKSNPRGPKIDTKHR